MRSARKSIGGIVGLDLVSLTLGCLVCFNQPVATLHAQQVEVTKDSEAQGTRVELPGVPNWLKGHQFARDKFTFARVRYESGRRGGSDWSTDFPDADFNLAAQVGKLTRLDVSQPSKVLRLTDSELVEYPFLYLSQAGRMILSEAEVSALRKHLLAGNFLCVDDSWGDSEWQNIQAELKRLFPDRALQDLPLTHPVFHCVFDIRELPQVPSIAQFVAGKPADLNRYKPRYAGISNEAGRLMVIVCHNTDLADGWERFGENEEYRIKVSQPKAFPMGINIVYHALTQGKRF